MVRMAKSVTKTTVAPDPMVERLRAALGRRAFTEQKMFGGTCFMINGNMLIGTSKRGLLVRVGKDGHAAAAARPHARPMEMGGRSMEGYVHVAPEGTATEADLAEWIDRALAFVETLPPKVKPAKVAKRPA
ncbi:hypothetical protein EOA32_33660 [Mesorhizobium sp. M1A.F.Ca.ET.072.01.1.1]|nr:hypothetical protein EOA32_33660 [Mesorhizobium sp. M1A.F.Ca.ET.072.01.1.1]TIV02977.1 MAG: TfoX/Sxy family protein [Mesorhizobium sp.]